jgi:hypothetical protein
METKQTAVDWLIEQIIKYELVPKGTNKDNVLFHKAKQMEKEQNGWNIVFENKPPSGIELLVKSPEGVAYLASWRESYHIFDCQEKRESSNDWMWKLI